MKKISQINWKRYKESTEGKEAIALFDKLQTSEATPIDFINAGKRYDNQFFKAFSKKEEEKLFDALSFIDNALDETLTEENMPETVGDCIALYYVLSCSFVKDEKSEDTFETLPQAAFKFILGDNILFSSMLYAYVPDFFIPNYFVMQFVYLKKFAEKYEIELPETPNRSDYKDRWTYYLELCNIFFEFANENDIRSGPELCAFLYDYELPVLKEEIEAEETKDLPKYPGRAWLIVGNYGEGEKDMESGFWQANQLTSKGDILLFYEKTPVKKLNSVWIALQDGVVDPFFHYYSNTYIGKKINIPEDKALTFDDFKNSGYFQTKGKKEIKDAKGNVKRDENGEILYTYEGNYVRKNFQDTSGWSVSNKDYAEIKRMLEAKGFDTSVLPQLYEPKKIGNIVITNEYDVSEKLLMPMLDEMGWHEGSDYEREVRFNAGRTETGADSEKRPDFCLHLKKTKDDIEAKVVIEVKEFMKNEKEISANFKQGRSYAKWGNARVLVICDQMQLIVYQRDKNNKFSESKGIKFTWKDREDPDKFAELKSLLS